MSLQVWLPLNGNLNNQGLLDSPSKVILQSGNSFSENGKIGQCLSSTTTNVAYFQDTSNNRLISLFNSGYIYSMAFWYKLTGNGTSGSIIQIGTTTPSSGSGNGVFGFWWTKDSGGTNPRLVWNDGDNGKRILSKSNDNSDIATDYTNWHHLVAIIDKTNMAAQRQIFYIDGVKVRDQVYDNSSANALTITNANNYIYLRPYYALLNDIRIYNHALSDKEIEEIAKGLVLHYKLDNIINTNLLENIPKSHSPTEYCGYQLNLKENLIAGQTYTIQLWDVDITHTGKTASNIGFSVYWGGGSVGLLHRNGSSYYDYYDEDSHSIHADYLCFTFTPTEANANHANAANLWLNIYNSVSNANGTRNMHIGAWKLEKGDAATAYGDNNGIVYDSSGYNNNGTIAGTLTVSENTSKYKYSTIFDGNTAAIQTPNLKTMITDKTYTISCWTYKTQIGSKNYQTIYGGPGGFELEARSSSTTNPLFRIHNWGGGTTPYEFGQWYHFCFVHTDDNSKLYINGELKITGTSANIPSGNYFIGAWNTSSQQNYDGNISDFRIYATALTLDQIKELYNTSASIDKNGNMYTRELVEK